MTDSLQVAAYEGGGLRFLDADSTAREAVLALPLSRLLVRMVRVPDEHRGDPAEYARPYLQAMNPYPDDPLAVSCETVRESERGLVVIAAAVPESALEEVGSLLDAHKLNVTRIDALALGQIRGMWSALGDGASRRLVLLGGADGISVLVMDGELPVAIRSVDRAGDMRRELMLSLLEAEDFGGSKEVSEVVVVGDVPRSGLETFGTVREVEVGEDAALVGVAERSAESGALNALPASWAEVLAESRLKARLVKRLAVAGGIWAFIMAVIFGVPVVFGYMTDSQKELSKEHRRQYQSVREMKDKADFVQKYSDHARGALEMMRIVSEKLPEDIVLDNFNYRMETGVKLSGVTGSSDSSPVYQFTRDLTDFRLTDADGREEELFRSVKLNGPSASRDGRQKFSLDCGYEEEEER